GPFEGRGDARAGGSQLQSDRQRPRTGVSRIEQRPQHFSAADRGGDDLSRDAQRHDVRRGGAHGDRRRGAVDRVLERRQSAPRARHGTPSGARRARSARRRPGRLVRQLLTESLLLGVIGGAVGLLVGTWGRNLLWSFRPAVVANNFVALRLDGRVFLFTCLLAIASSVVIGLIPALRASRPDVVGVLKEEAGTTAGTRRAGRLRRALVVAQVAMSLVALVVAGLFLRNIQQAFTVDLGYDPKPLSVVSANPGQAGYAQPRAEQFYRSARERVATIPGVASVSWAANQPLWASVYRRLIVEGREPQEKSDAMLTLAHTVDVVYFSTIG